MFVLQTSLPPDVSQPITTQKIALPFLEFFASMCHKNDNARSDPHDRYKCYFDWQVQNKTALKQFNYVVVDVSPLSASNSDRGANEPCHEHLKKSLGPFCFTEMSSHTVEVD